MKYLKGVTSYGICLAIQNYLFLCEIWRLQGAVSGRQVVTCRLNCWDVLVNKLQYFQVL